MRVRSRGETAYGETGTTIVDALTASGRYPRRVLRSLFRDPYARSMANILVRTLKVLASGCCVYIAIAACSGGGGSSATSADGSSGSTATSGGTPGSPVPNAMADDWYQPGSRLKLQYYEASDGTKTFVGVFDSARGEQCYFGLHADGSTRCLPTAGASSIFSDGGCVTPVIAALKSQPAPKYGYVPSGGNRRFAASIYAGAIFTGTPAACNSATAIYSTSTFEFYALGAEIPASAFVDATLKTSP